MDKQIDRQTEKQTGIQGLIDSANPVQEHIYFMGTPTLSSAC